MVVTDLITGRAVSKLNLPFAQWPVQIGDGIGEDGNGINLSVGVATNMVKYDMKGRLLLMKIVFLSVAESST